jgi:hypothetical protein
MSKEKFDPVAKIPMIGRDSRKSPPEKPPKNGGFRDQRAFYRPADPPALWMVFEMSTIWARKRT